MNSKQSAPNKISINSVIFKVQEQPLDNKSLEKTDKKQCKMKCRTGLDVGPGTTDIDVEFNSTLAR